MAHALEFCHAEHALPREELIGSEGLGHTGVVMHTMRTTVGRLFRGAQTSYKVVF